MACQEEGALSSSSRRSQSWHPMVITQVQDSTSHTEYSLLCKEQSSQMLYLLLCLPTTSYPRRFACRLSIASSSFDHGGAGTAAIACGETVVVKGPSCLHYYPSQSSISRREILPSTDFPPVSVLLALASKSLVSSWEVLSPAYYLPITIPLSISS